MKRQVSQRPLLNDDRFTRRKHPRQFRRDAALPAFDAGSSTRRNCILAVAVGAVLAAVCFALGIGIVVTQPPTLAAPVSISTAVQGVTVLAINIVITLCTDGMAYVHAVSLRWALYHEGRLEWNTNIRLLTSARESAPNRWYTNVSVLFCLALSYAASSALFLANPTGIGASLQKCDEETGSNCLVPPEFFLSGTAFLALGIGLAGQAAVATWCLSPASRTVPSWSSNPLNTALAAVRQGHVTHRPGRCMMAVHSRTLDTPAEGVYPQARQGSLFRARGTVRYVLGLLGGLAVLAVAWPATILLVSRSIGIASQDGRGVNQISPCWELGFDWSTSEAACSRNMVTLSMSPSANSHFTSAGSFPFAVQAVFCILFVCLVQGVQTLALHCVELLVNMSRDEAMWRVAHIPGGRTAPGARLVTGAFSAAAKSWENGVLFVLKAALHWAVGQGLVASLSLQDTGDDDLRYGFQFDMVYSRLIVYAVLAVLMAFFATCLALKQSRGCLPAAMGHVQTLADLIDDWDTEGEGRLWWCDKTGLLFDEDEIRHAGMSGNSTALAPIYMDARYAGIKIPV